MKCLTLFVLLLVLSQVFVNVIAKKASSHHKKTKSKEEPSYNKLPPVWTTAPRHGLAYQVNHKHAEYNKRLATVHKYHDNTRNLLKKSSKQQ